MTKTLDFRKPPVLIPDNRCEHCGRIPRQSLHTIAELVAITLCGCLLLATLTIAGLVACRWMDRVDREGRRLFDRPAWHEPLDDWSL